MASPEVEQPQAPVAPKPSTKARLTELFSRYGRLAIVVYLVLCVVTFAGSFVTVQFFGWKPQTMIGEAGVWTLAYVGYKLLQPVRIVALAALLPLIVKLTGRAGKAAAPSLDEPHEP